MFPVIHEADGSSLLICLNAGSTHVCLASLKAVLALRKACIPSQCEGVYKKAKEADQM